MSLSLFLLTQDASSVFDSNWMRFIEVFGAVLAIGISWLGWGLYRWKRRREWRSKTFMRQVNFSLNEVRDGTLHLRTVMEQPVLDVFLSEVAVDRVLAAAERTTKHNPFVALAADDDQAYVLRAVLNALSTRFAEAYLSRALGHPVDSKTFVFSLTCERTANVVTTKPRVMLIEERLLVEQFGPDSDPDGLEVVVPWHVDRIDTLKKMAKLYLSDDPTDKRLVSTIELGLPRGIVS